MPDLEPTLTFLNEVARDLIALSRHLGDGAPGRDVFIDTARDLWQMKVDIIMGRK